MDTRSGRCQCGQIEYEFDDEPFFTALCHCTECQKLSGSSFSLSSYVPADQFKVTGELKVYQRKGDSGTLINCYFCPTCGNRIYHTDEKNPEFVRLKPGSLNDTGRIKPMLQVFTPRRQKWLNRLNGLPGHRTQPHSKPEAVKTILKGRALHAAKLILLAGLWLGTAYGLSRYL